MTNPDQFVEDEDDDTFSYSVRISAQDLLMVSWNVAARAVHGKFESLHKIYFRLGHGLFFYPDNKI